MKTAAEFAAAYRPHKNLPPLAGIATFAEAMKPGLSIDACVDRVKRYHYALKRLQIEIQATESRGPAR